MPFIKKKLEKMTWKETAIRILMMTIGLIIGLFCIEIVLRSVGYDRHAKLQFINNKYLPTIGFLTGAHYTYDPVTGYSLVPNIVDKVRKITTDENGFRITSRPFDVKKSSVIFVGDSTVFGYLSPDQETFPYILSKIPEFAEYNIVNMGVPAYSLAHITQVIKHKVPRYKPKLVFVQILWPWKPFNSYPSSPNAWKEVDYTFYKKTTAVRNRFEVQSDLKLYNLRVLILLQDIWARLKLRKQINDNLSRPTHIYDFQVTEEFESRLALEHVLALREASKPLIDMGVQVVFYIHPFQYTLFRDEYKNLGMIGRRIIIDQLGAVYPGDFILDSYKQWKEPLFIDACHMTKIGNLVLARYFRDIMTSRLR